MDATPADALSGRERKANGGAAWLSEDFVTWIIIRIAPAADLGYGEIMGRLL